MAKTEVPTNAKGESWRVEIPAYMDRWMMGDRYGEVVEVELKRNTNANELWRVKLDKSGKTVRVVANDCKILNY